ncbi:MAG TPA: aspartate aminotransferase family protein [Terrimicrobiaceae bacterium]|nr:aspartate aminotransferase family protein [Terrimicrobiaceae bacterium]
MTPLSSLYADYVMPTYGRFELDIARGSGCRVWDFEGREYLDFGAGIAVCSLGHAHPEVTKVVTKQAATLVHTSNLYRTAPQAALARRLVELTGSGKVFFCNSGAEANEGLIKLARKFGNQSGRYEILTFENSFHGRTMAGISATAQEKIKKGFAPLLEGFAHLPFRDLQAVSSAIGPKTVAVMVEPVQGEGGIHIATPEFLRGLRRVCDEQDLLLLFDEIQCGLGRTGDWCGWRSIDSDAMPDGVSWAKGIANGFPLGSFWAASRRGLCDLLGPGTHGTTYGGNPVCCAAALKVLEIIQRDGLLENARLQGARLRDGLRALNSPRLREVRAVGLMIGFELENPGDANVAIPFVKRLIAVGLLAIPAGECVIRLLPPLNVTETEVDEALEKIGRVLQEG